LQLPRLLAINDLELDDPLRLASWAAGLARAGVEALQLRLKGVSDRALWRAADAVRQAFPSPRVLLINGRLDIALAVGADGVHLPGDGVPTAEIRRRLGPRLLGRSTHRVEEVTAAAAEGADYVVFGPVFSTPSKEGLLSPTGLPGLVAACAVGLPVFAIGGIDREALDALAAAGAAGAAGIRLFGRGEDLAALRGAAERSFRRP